jgi:hypothetical protein
MERYGPDEDITNLRLKVTADCPRRIANRILDLCGSSIRTSRAGRAPRYIGEEKSSASNVDVRRLAGRGAGFAAD